MEKQQVKIGDVIQLPADDDLGSVSEPVEVMDISEHALTVKQLTNANGEPGIFKVYRSSLKPIWF